MGKRSTRSWDKRHERKLKTYLKKNGYRFVRYSGNGSDHAIYESTVTGNSVVVVENHMNKMIWQRIIKEVQLDLVGKDYEYIPYNSVR